MTPAKFCQVGYTNITNFICRFVEGVDIAEKPNARIIMISNERK